MAFAAASLATVAFGVTIDYATVANPGNAAGTNPNGVYNSLMGSDNLGGITFNAGASSGSKYAVKSGSPTGSPVGTAYGSMPVLFTTWFSAAWFANWLQNGQQSNSASMETGAYTLNNQTSGAIVARNGGATNVLPSRDEWYKAGFYNGSSHTTWQPNSNTTPTNTVSNLTLANAANYGATVTPTLSSINVGSHVNTTEGLRCLRHARQCDRVHRHRRHGCEGRPAVALLG
jgi:hypothetical protein